jgi:hypothetical protein
MTMTRALRATLAGLLVFFAASAEIEGKPLFLHGGHPHGAGGGGGGEASACDAGGSGVCAQFQNGQTFITWPDMATGASGDG